MDSVDLGFPVYNLEVKIEEGHNIRQDDFKSFEILKKFLSEFFQGDFHLTNKGYFQRGRSGRLNNLSGLITIAGTSIIQWVTLEECLRTDEPLKTLEKTGYPTIFIKGEFGDTVKGTYEIKIDKGGRLYLPGIQARFASQVPVRGFEELW